MSSEDARMRDHYTLLAEQAGPAVLLTTRGGLVLTLRHRPEVARWAATGRWPGLLAAWDAAEPGPPRPPATVEQTLAMVARVAKKGA
jgi:hypothetical protein